MPKTSVPFDTADGQTVAIQSVEDWRGLVASRAALLQAAIRQGATASERVVVA